VEVLTGADTEKVRKWGHDTLSTYGIGKEHSREQWAVIGRELIRMGFLWQNPEKFNAVELRPEGMEALRSRKQITLTRSMPTTTKVKEKVSGRIECDEQLFEKLRVVRRKLAEAKNVPPYIVFSDVALRQMARSYPQNETEFSRISGVGEMKLKEYAATFLAAIREYLETNPRRTFTTAMEAPTAARQPRKSINFTTRETLSMFVQGCSVERIARDRKLSVGTVYTHLVSALENGESFDITPLVSMESQRDILAAFAKHGFENLTGAFEFLCGKYSFDQLRLVRALVGSWAGKS
jgi:ATP-dependent DNA helicase RecQ